MALLEEEGIDLRDPKLSVTPDGRLMLLTGGSIYEGEEYLTRAPRVGFSKDGRNWAPFSKVLSEDHWLWRATWHEGRAYSVSKIGIGVNAARTGRRENSCKRGFLYSSSDGLRWEWLTEFKLPVVSETTLRFTPVPCSSADLKLSRSA